MSTLLAADSVLPHKTAQAPQQPRPPADLLPIPRGKFPISFTTTSTNPLLLILVLKNTTYL